MSDNPRGPLVTADWLLRSKDPGLVIVDCRWDLIEHEKGYRLYMEGHIPGAFFVNMEKDLADLDLRGKGRHPIPDGEKFAAVMRRIGVSSDSTVICYDDDCSGSSRLWFLLLLYGHEKAFILDGGIKAYLESGGSLTREVPIAKPSAFTARPRDSLIATRKEILDGHLNMVDVRMNNRYKGEFEPIDPKKGHIPGASNFPYSIFTEDGKFKDAETLKGIMDQIGDDPVFYCGSGITSCVPFTASVIAGKRSRIYPGSWSEWVSYDDSPVVTENDL